jgi:phytoene synthase
VPEVYGEAPADLAALKTYLGATSGAIFALAAAILGAEEQQISEAAEAAGFAYGLARLLCTLPQQTARRRLLLPPSFLEGRGVEPHSLFRGESSPRLAAALAELRDAAHGSLLRWRAIMPTAAEAFPAFLPLAVVMPYLKAMARPDFHPLRDAPRVNPFRRFLRIWWAARTRRI